jgi:uracil DNA glycosylase
LNTALTTEVGKIGAHYEIWKPFTAYLLDWLNNYNPGLIYVYMGRKAEEWSDLTNDTTSYKFTVKHPASAAYSGSKWDSDNIFMRTRAVIKKMSGKSINW